MYAMMVVERLLIARVDYPLFDYTVGNCDCMLAVLGPLSWTAWDQGAR